MKQPLINDTIDLVEPMEFDRRSFAEVLHRRVEKKSATGSAMGRQQLDVDLHAILKGRQVHFFENIICFAIIVVYCCAVLMFELATVSYHCCVLFYCQCCVQGAS